MLRVFCYLAEGVLACYDRSMLKERVYADVAQAVKDLGKDSELVFIERPRDTGHGDFSTNVALRAGEPEVASELAKKLSKDSNYEATDVHGFVNIFLNEALWHEELKKILDEGEDYARLDIGKKEKVNVEFISANPTGPLTVGNARGGFVGDAVAAVLEKTGHEVTREYYFNDAGTQVSKLVASVRAHAEGVVNEETQYSGEYVDELAKEFKGESDKEQGKEVTETIFKRYIKGAIERMGIEFDVWSNECELIESGAVDVAFERLEKMELLYEKEGALWLKGAQENGEDAVLVKSDGAHTPTYLLADLAYHYDKFKKRKFDVAVNIWGADHHGYVGRMKKGIEALGIDPEHLRIIVTQLVLLVRGDKEVKMSKRSGDFVTLDELLKIVGKDAARWFFLERAPETHMNFNFDYDR